MKTYTSRRSGNRHVVSIANHTEIVGAITEFCSENDIHAGSIHGIGAVSEATLRFFDPATKKYVDKKFAEQMEIANLTGNISAMDGKVYIHLHITLGKQDYTALAGHLLSAVLNGAGEFVIEKFDDDIRRRHDDDTGLNVYDF